MQIEEYTHSHFLQMGRQAPSPTPAPLKAALLIDLSPDFHTPWVEQLVHMELRSVHWMMLVVHVVRSVEEGAYGLFATYRRH